MSKTKQFTIDESKPFSQSQFWQGQRHFYHEKGVEAWAGEVPFYITSNPFIADTYAKCLVRFIQDWTRKFPESINHPFYIIELGAGSGQFSFYILNSIFKLKKAFNLNKIKIRYIITDFTENNLKFWQQHEKLKLFIEDDLVDFALFDIENDTSLTTVNQKIKLAPNSSKNPITVIANYLFDSIINDIFKVKKNKIYESLVSLTTQKNNLTQNTPKDWEKVKINHTEKLITSPYYNDSLLNEILNLYCHELEDSFLLFPIGALQGLKNLQALSNNKLLLITSDKGYTSTFELDGNEYPELDFHGSFSLMVNYHAIAQFFRLSGGDAFIQTPRDGITTCVFSNGFKFNELTETSYFLSNNVEGFSPSDFFNFYELIYEVTDEADLKLLASTLCLSHWDPFIFEHVSARLIELFEKENTELIDYIVNNLPNIVENFYFVPGCDDIFFDMGLLMYEIDHYLDAIQYYQQSLKYFAPAFEIYYNLGLSHFYNENHKQAAQYFKEALKHKPKHREANKMLKTCSD